MKKTFHLCWSGGDEILFRSKEDYIHGIICLCIATYETGSSLLAYILRNPLHHGVCSSPFGYPYSSARAAFYKELGYHIDSETTYAKSRYGKIPDRHKLPEAVKTNADGLIRAESIVDLADLEHQFSTARTYLYYMNRLSGDAWEREQNEDKKSTLRMRSDIKISPYTLFPDIRPGR